MRGKGEASPAKPDAGSSDYLLPGSDRLLRLLKLSFLFLVPVVIVYMRGRTVGYQSPDFQIYLSQWYAHLDAQGTEAFRESFSDYNMPYLYMLLIGAKLNLGALLTVKLISNAFDVLLALAVYRVVARMSTRDTGILAAFTVMVLPSVWLNSAAWGQADSIYASFCILSLDSWLRGRQRWSWFWIGVAFSMKFQTVFFLPWLCLAWALRARRDVQSPLFFLIAPLVSLVPALVWGASLQSVLSVYYGQTQKTFFANSYGFWRLFNGGERDPGVITRAALPLAAICLLVFAYLLIERHRWNVDESRMVASAAAIALLLPFLLPNMRDRYYFLAEILILIYAFVRPSRWWLSLIVAMTLGPTYTAQLLKVPAPLDVRFWVLVMGLVLALLIRESLSLSNRLHDRGDATMIDATPARVS